MGMTKAMQEHVRTALVHLVIAQEEYADPSIPLGAALLIGRMTSESGMSATAAANAIKVARAHLLIDVNDKASRYADRRTVPLRVTEEGEAFLGHVIEAARIQGRKRHERFIPKNPAAIVPEGR